MRCHLLLTICFSLAITTNSLQAAEQINKAKDWVYLENDHVRLGLLRSHGGAIGYLSEIKSQKNLLNAYDHGRLVQQSYYGDADGSLWSKKPWRYNPVQGVSYRGVPAVVKEFTFTKTSSYAKTIPRHWASGDLLDECIMEQWIELHGPVVQMRYQLTYNGSKTHKSRHQETPAVFIAPELKTLITYAGNRPWEQDELKRHLPGWPNESVSMTENWAAYVDDKEFGVGIYVPDSTKATSYRYQGGKGSNCSYIAPLQIFSLKPKLKFSYNAYLTVGQVESIRQRFEAIRNTNEK